MLAAQIVAQFADGTLQISGTDSADTIHIDKQQVALRSGKKGPPITTDVVGIPGAKIVDANGKKLTLPVASVKQIAINGGAGNDTVILENWLKMPVAIDGQAGSDQVISRALGAVAIADPKDDRMVSGIMADLWKSFTASGVQLGVAVTNAFEPKTGGYVQQFENCDIWVSQIGPTSIWNVELYDSIARHLSTYTLSTVTNALTSLKNFEAVNYTDTRFFNSRISYDVSPTLIVEIHGAILGTDGGYGSYVWEQKLCNNAARLGNLSGSMIHVMEVDWASELSNSSAVAGVKDVIASFLADARSPWDVLLVGHSRGAIFAADLAKSIGKTNISRLELVMLDPTAFVSGGDQYPTGVSSNVDRAVVYDDGLHFMDANTSTTVDTQTVPGAEYVRVSIKGAGKLDTKTSHDLLATRYAQGYPASGNSQLTFDRDLMWLMTQKAIKPNSYSDTRDRIGLELVKTARPDGKETLFSLDAKDGSLSGRVTIPLIGGGYIMIGKNGLNAGVGTTFWGNGNISVSQNGLVVYASNGFGRAGLILTSDEVGVDVGVGPISIKLSTNGGRIDFGGDRLDFSSVANLKPGAMFVSHIFENGFRELRVMSVGRGGSPTDAAQTLVKQLSASPSEVVLALSKDLLATPSQIAGILKSSLLQNPTQIVTALHSALPNLAPTAIAKALWEGVPGLSRVDIASAIWKGWSGITHAGVAESLWNGIANTTRSDIAAAMWNGIGHDLQAVASGLKQVGSDFDDIARAVWGGIGHDVNIVADVLDQVGADFGDIANAVWLGVGQDVNIVGDALERAGADFGDMARAVWGGIGHNVGIVGDVLVRTGADFGDIARAVWGGIGHDPNIVGDVLSGAGADFGDIARAVWGGIGHDVNALGDILERVGADFGDIARAVWEGVGHDAEIVGDALVRVGADFGDIARAVWGGIGRSETVVADALQHVGADLGDIARAFWAGATHDLDLAAAALNHLGASGEQMFYALRDGIGQPLEDIRHALISVGVNWSNLPNAIKKIFNNIGLPW